MLTINFPVPVPSAAQLANHPVLRSAEDDFLRAVARVLWDDLDRRTRAELDKLGCVTVTPAG